MAHTLGVSERTVAFHLANARSHMGARAREAQAAKVWRVS
ncbi:MAG: LuxR C-terminal-related transcriptional regulator [Pseudomonadota bacterium]